MKFKEFVAISWLVMWSGIEPGVGTTTTSAPSIVELALPPEGAVPAFATSEATYSAHFRKKSGEDIKVKDKTELTAKFPQFSRGVRTVKDETTLVLQMMSTFLGVMSTWSCQYRCRPISMP